ncbi:MAG: protein-methionine-sulfoxide reductase catalytic subunit MsrP [Vicinamibacterales bacterium]
MLIGKPADIRYSEITPKATYLRRREFLQAASAAAVGTAAALAPSLSGTADAQVQGPGVLPKLSNVKTSALSTTEKQSAYSDFSTYNNFYEFGADKASPAINAKRLKTRPWKIAIEGHVAKPAVLDFDEFVKPYVLEERIYRHRCVETWSAVVPWIGIPMADIVRRLQPTSQARFVEFVTLFDPVQMPWQHDAVLQWPYIEGLRLDEAMNPLTILAVGMYGEILPNQNGAPIRLVVPWKYGFKGGKSLVKIRFVESMPRSTWMIKEPPAYGFYANVNPTVDHPRWSQTRERRLGEFVPRRTTMFNGYTDQVAKLYAGMDLRRNY